MTAVVDLGDPTNPPVVDLGDPSVPPSLDLNWSPSTVDLPIGVGVQGEPGADGGGGLQFQLTAASSASLAHNLAYPPMVHLSVANTFVMIGAEYPDSTHVFIEFPTPFTGTVVLT